MGLPRSLGILPVADTSQFGPRLNQQIFWLSRPPTSREASPGFLCGYLGEAEEDVRPSSGPGVHKCDRHTIDVLEGKPPGSKAALASLWHHGEPGREVAWWLCVQKPTDTIL